MTVERDRVIRFDEEQIIRMEGASLERVLARPTGRAAWAGALAEARELAQGSAVWEFHPVREIRHGRVVLDAGPELGGITLGSGPLASVVAGASHLGVAVCTIGGALGRRVQEHQRGGDMLRGLLLDSLGTWAVDKLRQEICCRLEDEATAAGLRTSTALCPGESEWGIQDQAVLFRLVDASAIGVSLTESLIMNPLKSLSLVVGRGAGPLGREGESHCDYCTMKDRCPYRERRDADKGKEPGR
jgi:hypothetical protein